MPKTVKLADIAQRLGVSAVTVSKALSGQKGVSEEMREKIKLLADEMGYVKSVAPEKGKGHKSYTIGIVVAKRYLDEVQSFYWRVYQDLSQCAVSRNCFTMLEVVSYEDERQGNLPKMVTEGKVEAVIVMGAFKVEYARFLRQNINLPFILLDTLGPDAEFDAVVSNNMMGAYRVVNYLFQMGHSKIGFVGTRLATASIDDRYFGYLKSAMEHGMEVQPHWLVDDRDRDTGMGDYQAHYRLPDKDGMPTAFFCNCDKAAEVMVHKLSDYGYRVPEDVSLAGFDNYLADPLFQAGITTYAINTREMARRAVHILVHKLREPDYSAGVYMIDGTFIERESVRRIGPPIPFV